MYSTLYIGPLAPPRDKACTTYCFFLGLVVHQSEEALLTFWDLSNYKGSCRQDAHPLFLKTKGTQQPSNSYISLGTKLHPPHPNQDCLPTYCINLYPKSVFQCLKNGSLEVVLALAGSVFDKVGSYDQTGQPIQADLALNA